MRTKSLLTPALWLALLALAIAFPAAAQVTPITTKHMLTNGTTVIIDATADQSNIVASTTVVVELQKDRGLGVQATIGSTNAATLQTGISFAVSGDGTSYTTANNYWFIIPALNGTSPVTAFTNFPAQLLNNARYIKILQITNGHTASLFVTNVIATFNN